MAACSQENVRRSRAPGAAGSGAPRSETYKQDELVRVTGKGRHFAKLPRSPSQNLTTTEVGIRTDPISSALKGLATIA